LVKTDGKEKWRTSWKRCSHTKWNLLTERNGPGYRRGVSEKNVNSKKKKKDPILVSKGARKGLSARGGKDPTWVGMAVSHEDFAVPIPFHARGLLKC